MGVDEIMRSGQGVDPSTSQTTESKKIQKVNVYEFMDNAHSGGGGFRDGEYLVPHEREMFFDSRKTLAFYKNFLKPILRAMLEPVFDERVSHTVTEVDNPEKVIEGSLMSAFVEDCNGAGMHLQDFVKMWVRRARLHGVAFAVMDNFSSEDMPSDVATAKKERKFPYVYLKKASQIPLGDGKGFALDDFGELEWIIFKDKDDKKDKANTKRWRKWTKTETVLVKQKTGSSEKMEEISKTRRTHNLGVVPVSVLFAVEREDLDIILVDPPLYDLARLCHALYNKTSEARSQERSQGFAIFYVQTNNPGASFTIGDKTILYLPEDCSIPPGYASPDTGILEGLMKNEERLREDIFRIAEQNGVTGVQNAKSGVAIQWDFFAHESVLKATSILAVIASKKISRLFSMYVPSEPYEILAEYPADFQPNDKEKELALYDKYNLMSPPSSGIALALEKSTRLVFSDEDPERVKVVIDQIQEEEKSKETSTLDKDGNPIEDDTELDDDGNPVVKEPDLAGNPGEEGKASPLDVKRVLNAGQVTSMVDVVKSVGGKEIERTSGLAILETAFGLSPEEASDIIGTGELEPPKKESPFAPPTKKEGEEDDDDTGTGNPDDNEEGDE